MGLEIDLQAESIHTPRQLLERVLLVAQTAGLQLSRPLVLQRPGSDAVSSARGLISEMDGDLDKSLLLRGLRNHELLVATTFSPSGLGAAHDGSPAAKRLCQAATVVPGCCVQSGTRLAMGSWMMPSPKRLRG